MLARFWPGGVLLAITLACGTPGLDSEYLAGIRLLESGDHGAAAERWEAALELAASDPKPLRSLLRVLRELGELYATYSDLGRETRAEQLLAHALALAVERYGEDDPSYLRIANSLGSYYANQKRWEEAEPLLESVLKALLRQQGPEVAYRSQTAGDLRAAYRGLQRPEKLEDLQQALENPALSLMQSLGAVPDLPEEELYLQPNVRDVDRTPAFVHYSDVDMPLRVALGRPDAAAADSTVEETVSAVGSAFRRWASAIRRVYPSFSLEIVDVDPAAPIQVVWRRRPRSYLPGRGAIGYSTDGGELRVRSRIVLSTQPIPTPGYHTPLGELRVFAAHAMGSALGLPDCSACDSIMSLGWRRKRTFQPTDVDLRTFEALMRRPSGLRIDGQLLSGLSARDGLPAVGSVGPPEPEPGVLAEVPFINTGDDRDIQIDMAPKNGRSFVVTLDTGASDTVLTTAYARAMGISVRSVKTDQYRRPTITGDPLPFWVTGQRVVGGGRGPTHFDYALLGGEFMKDYVVDIDFEARVVRFLDPSVHQVGVESEDFRDEIVVGLRMVSNRPQAELAIGNGSVWALVDTGFQGSLTITEEKASELGIEINRDAPRVTYRNVFAHSVELVHEIPQVSLGPVVLRDVELLISVRDLSQVRVTRMALQSETLVGIDILKGYRVRFDYPRGKMGLTPISRLPGGGG